MDSGLSELEKAQLKTLVYYNSLNYPLTSEEINFFLFFRKKDFNEAEAPEGLKNLIAKKLSEESDGFYFLPGRKELVKERKIRNEIAKEKWSRTLKAGRWLKAVPYVRMVFGSGSLALHNTTKKSDLDVLVVVKRGRIWLTRFLIVLLLSLSGVRRARNQKVAPDKICLNHFITDQSLHIPRKSIFTAQLYARLVPISCDDQKILEEFKKENSWIGDYIAGWPECLEQNPRHQIPQSKFLAFMKKTGEKLLDTKFGDWLERILGRYQLRRIKNSPLFSKPGGRIKADDLSLEFHPDSPELRIIGKYNETMERLGFRELAGEMDSGLTKI